ncbi:MAG TPA: DUF3458 domain-containing protein, partial [Alphaproteobacteria bacterium]|nr:DUF3458 domain-containing protein [Alphaproteobacteria bacterium]
YAQAGTPLVEGSDAFDPATGRYTLRLRQSYPEIGYEHVDEARREPVVIPVAMGLLGPSGAELPLQLDGEAEPAPARTRVLELAEAEQVFTFVGLEERPVASLLRDFSAPVRLRMERSAEDLAFLMAHDPDPFNRWDAGQELATRLLLELAARHARGEPLSLDPLFSEAFGRVLGDRALDGSLRALALTLPSEKVLGQEMDVVDPDALFAAREFVRRTLAEQHGEALLAVYREAADGRPYSNDAASIDRRRLKGCALAYLVARGDEAGIALAAEQFEAADNMTDAQAALSLLADTDTDAARRALEAFYERWRSDPLVLDKWFAIQASSRRTDALERVLALAEHPDWSLRNPNRVRALVGTFCAGNQVRFHAADGGGYRFLADMVGRLDPLNPQVAARLAALFNPWRRFDAARQALMQAELEAVRARPGLSKDVYEIVTRALGT